MCWPTITPWAPAVQALGLSIAVPPMLVDHAGDEPALRSSGAISCAGR
jgi:hypothetical protein